MNADRFKFRAYSKAENKMIYFSGFQVGFDESGNAIVTCKECDIGKKVSLSGYSEPMQSTGLRDRNGVLIFESDIVQYPDRSDDKASFTVTEVVTWDADASFSIGSMVHYLELVEVIGNVYQNPDLIP